MSKPKNPITSTDITSVVDDITQSIPLAKSEFSYLVMIYGEYLGRRFPIKNDPITIGRSPECTIQLTDDCVSRLHCRILRDEEGTLIIDEDSTNGCQINEARIASRRLKDQDLIRTGRSIFKFLTGNNIEHAYHEEIYRLMTTDSLTGAYNKRYFEKELRRGIYRLIRYKRPLSMVMMDIDHFKNVNDEYGHLAGDRVLAQLGDLILSIIRHEDTFCRYGGEEFALLLPETGIVGAADIANRIREKIELAAFEYDNVVFDVTVSGGVAEANITNIVEPEDLVRAADKQLYAAKNAGRNCIKVDQQEIIDVDE